MLTRSDAGEGAVHGRGSCIRRRVRVWQHYPINENSNIHISHNTISTHTTPRATPPSQKYDYGPANAFPTISLLRSLIGISNANSLPRGLTMDNQYESHNHPTPKENLLFPHVFLKIPNIFSSSTPFSNASNWSSKKTKHATSSSTCVSSWDFRSSFRINLSTSPISPAAKLHPRQISPTCSAILFFNPPLHARYPGFVIG